MLLLLYRDQHQITHKLHSLILIMMIFTTLLSYSHEIQKHKSVLLIFLMTLNIWMKHVDIRRNKVSFNHLNVLVK
jgi:hypothetical protein